MRSQYFFPIITIASPSALSRKKMPPQNAGKQLETDAGAA
jgi:hypothetical protein